MRQSADHDPHPIRQATHPGRNALGKFVKGNTARMTHGGQSVVVRLALIDQRRAALEDRRTAIIADLGGEENVSTIRADLIERYLETSLIAEYLGGNLLVDGVMTAKGRARAAASFYLQVLDRLQRLTAALGLDRKARDVYTLSPEQYAKRQQQHGGSDAEHQNTEA